MGADGELRVLVSVIEWRGGRLLAGMTRSDVANAILTFDPVARMCVNTGDFCAFRWFAAKDAHNFEAGKSDGGGNVHGFPRTAK